MIALSDRFGQLTLWQPILDVLAEMIAYDGTLKIGSFTGGGSMNDMMREMGEMSGMPSVGLD